VSPAAGYAEKAGERRFCEAVNTTFTRASTSQIQMSEKSFLGI